MLHLHPIDLFSLVNVSSVVLVIFRFLVLAFMCAISGHNVELVLITLEMFVFFSINVTFKACPLIVSALFLFMKMRKQECKICELFF